MEYLYKNQDKLGEKLRNKYLFIFLDYDGTLTPIAKTPEQALMLKGTKKLLEELSQKPYCKIAIISGRSLSDIKNKLGLKNIIYSGNHGLEIEGPKLKFTIPASPKYRDILIKIKEDLQNKITSIKGAFIEDKGLSLTLHFRLVDKKKTHLVKTAFHEAVILYLVGNKIKIKPGKMALEVRPVSEWDKGKVVLWFLSKEKFFKAASEILPIYVGDDITDEDAFKALKHIGITIFVGKPKESSAQYYLKDSLEVGGFLKTILEIKKGKKTCCQ